jgi:hypothetical protein
MDHPFLCGSSRSRSGQLDDVFYAARDRHGGDVASMLDDPHVVKAFRVPRRDEAAECAEIDGREAHLCEDGVWVCANWRRRGFDVWHDAEERWVPYRKAQHRYKTTACRYYDQPSECSHHRSGRCDFVHHGEPQHTIRDNVLGITVLECCGAKDAAVVVTTWSHDPYLAVMLVDVDDTGAPPEDVEDPSQVEDWGQDVWYDQGWYGPCWVCS